MTTNNVIKIEPDIWRTLSGLKQSIKFYNQNNKDGRYDNALSKETKLYKSMYSNNVISKYFSSDEDDTAVAA